jgi:CheY-like chemotaxis protein
MPHELQTASGEKRSARTSAACVRVLVVNDHWANVESMARLLRIYGHEVETALRGSSALKAAKAFSPDVVLLDISMPDIDGFEVARQLRKLLRPDVLIVALTALGLPEDRKRCFDAGFDLHLVKPVNPIHVETLLQNFGASLVNLPSSRGTGVDVDRQGYNSD